MTQQTARNNEETSAVGDHVAEKSTIDADQSDERQNEQPDERRTHEVDDVEAREEFGGVNWGAAFFGWLVAIAMAVLVSSIIGAIASGVGTATNLTQTQAQRDAGTLGIAAAAAIVVVLLFAYFTGGYVAGRMSRFDGGRTGSGVWLIGLVATLLAVGLGIVFGDQYNVLDRVDLPRIPVPRDDATLAGIITAIALVFGTLVTATLGGKFGRRYHGKVDRAVHW